MICLFMVILSMEVLTAQANTKEIRHKTTYYENYLTRLVDTMERHSIYRIEQVFLDNDKQFGFFGSYDGFFTNGNPYTSDVVMIYDKVNESFKKSFSRYGDANDPKTYYTIAYNEQTTEMIIGGDKTVKFFNKDSARFFHYEIGASAETRFSSSACLSKDLYSLAGTRNWNDSVAMNIFFYHRDVNKIKSKNVYVAKYGGRPAILRASDNEVVISYSYHNEGEKEKHVIEKLSFDNPTRKITSIWKNEYTYHPDNKLEMDPTLKLGLTLSDRYLHYFEGAHRFIQFNNYYIRAFGIGLLEYDNLYQPGFIMYDLNGKKVTEFVLPSTSGEISVMEILPLNENLFAVVTVEESDVSSSGTNWTSFKIDFVDGTGKYIKSVGASIQIEVFYYAVKNAKEFSIMGIYDYSTKYQKAIFTILDETY